MAKLIKYKGLLYKRADKSGELTVSEHALKEIPKLIKDLKYARSRILNKIDHQLMELEADLEDGGKGNELGVHYTVDYAKDLLRKLKPMM